MSKLMPKTMRNQVLITGGAGYIGSVLVKQLIEYGYNVICLDRFFFGKKALKEVEHHPNLTMIKDDIRWFDPAILKNVGTVIDMAALSNDPTGELEPSKTFDINFLGRRRVARLAKEYGVRRYILASSCSVYGFQDGILDESSKVDPLTTYAKANRKAEQDIILLSDSNFSATVLRFATAYGYSGRMRFDLAINAMVLDLYNHRIIRVMRSGQQWRPFIHVKDIATACYLFITERDMGKVEGEIFNVGSDSQNYQILPLAELIAGSVGISYSIDMYGSSDFRSYKVSFEKIRKTLDFQASLTPNKGSIEIFEALKSGNLRDSPETKTVEWYKRLINCHELMSQLSLRDTLL